MLEEVESVGVGVHGTSFAGWTSKRHSPLVLQSVREISKLLRDGRFDIVHSYLYWPDIVASFAGRLAGSRRIIVSRRSLHAGRHQPRRWLHALESASNHIASELVANSRAVLEDAEHCEQWLPSKRTVIYNGIDVDEYGTATPGSKRGIRIVSVANFNEWKDHSSAVQALSSLRSKGIDASLILVGSGSREPVIRAAVSRLKLAAHIKFVGSVSDPREHLIASDVFLLPSLQEGFSNAILEAMASGLPVVATDVGGNRETFVDGVGGRLVPLRDVEGLAEALCELAEDRGLMARMGDANRTRVAEHFTIAESARQLAALYFTPKVRTAASG